jgi:hypothetical protein
MRNKLRSVFGLCRGQSSKCKGMSVVGCWGRRRNIQENRQLFVTDVRKERIFSLFVTLGD